MNSFPAAHRPHATTGKERATAVLRRLGEQLRQAVRRADAWHGEFTARLPLPAFCKSRTMTALIVVFAVLLFVYVGLAAMLYFAQRSMMYFPETIHTSPAEAGLPEAEEISLTAADGVHIVGWHVVPHDGKPVILYLHGNGGALRYRVERFHRLIKEGLGLLAVEYRGYGGSEGSPSEAGLFADAEAAYAFAAGRYRPDQLVLWGESLGTGLAVYLAAEKPVGRVILEAPFTSTAAVAARRYWFMPVRLLMKDQFRSDERIANVTAPVLILHGLNDRVVPYAMGEQMFDLAKGNKHIVRFIDGGHEDLDQYGALHAVGRFLAGDLDQPPAPPTKH
jgi:fermentation-respiration switch protein FrsA (DUF1100 family)